MTLTQGLLDQIARLLNRDATNYTVFLRLYQVPKAGDDDSAQLGPCIRKAVNAEAEIDDAEAISAMNLLIEVEGMLRYAGDPGAGPSDSVVRSTELSGLLMELKNGTSELAAQAKVIKHFWFKSGHPAYPVFWDFAYAFFMDEMTAILIGSSSD